MELAIIALIVLALVVIKLGNDYTQLKRNYRDSVQEAAREQQELRAQLANYRASLQRETKAKYIVMSKLDELSRLAAGPIFGKGAVMENYLKGFSEENFGTTGKFNTELIIHNDLCRYSFEKDPTGFGLILKKVGLQVEGIKIEVFIFLIGVVDSEHRSFEFNSHTAISSFLRNDFDCTTSWDALIILLKKHFQNTERLIGIVSNANVERHSGICDKSFINGKRSFDLVAFTTFEVKESIHNRFNSCNDEGCFRNHCHLPFKFLCLSKEKASTSRLSNRKKNTSYLCLTACLCFFKVAVCG